MRLNLKLIRLSLFSGLLLIADFDKNELAQFTEGSRGRKPAAAPQSLMALFDSSNQILSRNRFNVIFGSLIETEFLGLSVGFRQIGKDILFTLKRSKFIRNIQNSTGSAGNNNNILCTQFYPSGISNALFYRLVKFSVCNTVFFALYDSIRALAVIVGKNNNVCTVSWKSIRNNDLYTNSTGRIFVFIN